MKLKYLICTILVLVVFFNISQFHFVEARLIPRFKHLVENEPADPFVEFTGTLPAESIVGYDKRSDTFTEYSLLANTFLIPVKINSHTIMAIGAGFEMHQLRDEEDLLSNRVMSLYEHIFATGNINQNWYWLTYQNFGHYASYDNNYFHKSALKYLHLLGVGYKFNSVFSITVGLIYDTKFGYHSFMPMIRIGWSFDNFVLTVFIPLYARIRYYITDHISIYLAGKYNQESFREERHRNNDQYQYTEYGRFEVNVGFEFYLNSTLCLTPSFSYYFRSPIKRTWDGGEDRVSSLPEEFMISFGVQLRI